MSNLERFVVCVQRRRCSVCCIRYNYGAERTNEWCEWLAYNGNSRYLARTRRSSDVVGPAGPAGPELQCRMHAATVVIRAQDPNRLNKFIASAMALFSTSLSPFAAANERIHIAISRERVHSLWRTLSNTNEDICVKWQFVRTSISVHLFSWPLFMGLGAICSMCFGSSNEALK